MTRVFMLLLTIYVVLGFSQISWPHPPQDSVHPIGNSWGNFQDYGGGPYLHNGQDIMTTPLCPVTVIKDGYVKRVWQSGQLYTGISVADSAGAAFCEGYMYYHVDPATVQVTEGDSVYVGDTIAQIVTWPTANFHHNHFSKNHNSGTYWNSYGAFFLNPLTEFVPDDDSTAPIFSDAVANDIFAICTNNTSTYLDPDSVYGDVDIICRVEDRINHPTWWVAVYRLEYTIYDTTGTIVVPLSLGIQFSDSIESYYGTQVTTAYKDDATCNSNCDYNNNQRRYYFIVTNTDGDSLIEATDIQGSWQTGSVINGPYWIKIIASDEYGNAVAESMLVWVKNPTGIHEQDVHTDRWIRGMQVFPNPSNGRTYVHFAGGVGHDISVTVYNAAGTLVRSFRDMIRSEVPVTLVWQGKDDQGRQVPAGVYFVEARDGVTASRTKLIIVQ
ncbi:MAG: T9SS type A sorting domain-containing protein [candidate division WOR-3 bacterium]|nr:MAG: T9SS type A sorting domain-containing protein [candidate division WOR-3 bacterium]